MASYTDIRNAIMEWIEYILPNRQKVLFNNPEMGKPFDKYITVFIQTSSQLGRGRRYLATDGLSYIVANNVIFILQLQLFGGDVMEDGRRLINSLYEPNRFLDIYKVMGHLNTPSQRDISRVVNGHTQQISQILFNFMTEIEDSYSASYFDSINVTIKASDKELNLEVKAET